jgi:predicted aspartyl protease
MCVLSDKAADRLGIQPIARGGRGRAVGGGGSFPIIYGLLDSIQIGDARIDAVPVYIREMHLPADMPSEEQTDGYLGLSALADYTVTLDYEHLLFTLDRRQRHETAEAADVAGAVNPNGTDPATRDDVIVPLRSTSGGQASAEIHVAITPDSFNFIVDTAASMSVISKAAVKRHDLGNLKLPNERFRVIGVAGVDEGVEALRLSGLAVSGLKQNNARALILDLEPVNETAGFEQHGILGGDFLRHFRVRLDLKRYEMTLTPQSDAITPVTRKQSNEPPGDGDLDSRDR